MLSLVLASATLSIGLLSAFGAPPAHAEDLIRSSFEKGELIELCNKNIKQSKDRFDAITKIAADKQSIDNTLIEFENASADLGDSNQPLGFMKYVSPDSAINAEGAQCEQAMGDFMVTTFGRRDLYNALRNAQPRNPQEKRLLEKTLEDFESNGLKLPDDKLAQVTALMAKLNELQNSFSANLNKDNTTVDLTAEELSGVSPQFLSRLKKTADGKYTVTTKITDYEQVMENAKSSDARKKMAFAYNNRQGQVNTALLEEAITTREKIATLMGFATWADYQLSHNRMAKDAPTVLEFLNGLKDKLAIRRKADLAQLVSFQKKLDPKARAFNSWDIPYLSYQLKKHNYSLDDDQIREYFPSDLVVAGMLKIYSQMLGVKFEPVVDAHNWAPDVKLYKIINNNPKAGKQDDLIGYFYTDFIPRQGKYEHFASFTIISGRETAKGYNKPISAIVGNFNPPSDGKPSLLNHEEVITLFHEFGHVMHQTLTKAPYASLSGSNVAQDFVEAPSQMLENWPWEKNVLALLSGNYKNPTQKLPNSLLKKMLEARDYQQGLFYTRQLMLALTDMNYHTAKGPVDVTAVYDKMYKDLMGIDPIQGGHFVASFGHLMGGYDAGYYGYLWSEVYAEDMFTVFQKGGVLSPVVGARYREDILSQGNMQDAQVLLTNFLGRPSNNKAFLKKLHIK